MKIIVTLLSFALATGALFSSCSKTELGEVTPPETKVPGEDEISPRFTSNNLTYAEAIDFVQPFLEREPEFRFAKIFDREPGYYIQYNGSFCSSKGPSGICFRGISCSAIRREGKPFIIYSSSPSWRSDINSLSARLKTAEDIYEIMADGSRNIVGRTYKYETNCRSECWLSVSAESVPNFEAIVYQDWHN